MLRLTFFLLNFFTFFSLVQSKIKSNSTLTCSKDHTCRNLATLELCSVLSPGRVGVTRSRSQAQLTGGLVAAVHFTDAGPLLTLPANIPGCPVTCERDNTPIRLSA